mgnify:CR=1 FL=1
MAKPIRIFEGRFGRVVLADASAPGEPQTLSEPLIFLKHDGADSMFSIGSAPQPLTREDALRMLQPADAFTPEKPEEVAPVVGRPAPDANKGE